MLLKAVRGGQNLAFGLLTEVPRAIYYEGREEGPVRGAAIGLFKGIGLGILRTLVGGYELLTFPIPLNDYEPVMRPAFPFEPGQTEAFPEPAGPLSTSPSTRAFRAWRVPTAPSCPAPRVRKAGSVVRPAIA